MSTVGEAQQLCSTIQAKSEILKKALPGIKSTAKSADDVITGCMKALGYSDTTIASWRQTLNVSAAKACVQSSAVVQTNEFDISECAKTLGCRNRSSATYRAELEALLGKEQAAKQIDLLNEWCTFTSTQSNSADISQSCAITSALDVLQQQPFSPLVQILVGALTEGKPFDCSQLPAACTSAQYAKAVQVCIAYSELNQANVARCVSSTEQSNSAQLFQSCVLSNTAPTKTDIDASASVQPITNTNSQTAPPSSSSESNTSSSSSSSSSAMGYALIGIALVFVYGYIRYRTSQSSD